MRAIALAVLALGIPFAAMAKPVMYECTMGNLKPAKGWVTEVYYFNYDAEAGTATAHDAITEVEMGGAVPAKISGKTDKKVAFTWAVQTRDSSGQMANMQYRAALYTDGKVTITARPPGYQNMFEARGTCVAKPGK